LSTVEAQQKSSLGEDYMLISCLTYLKLKKGADQEFVQNKINDWSKRVINPWLSENEVNGKVIFALQKIRDIHFDTYYIYDSVAKGNYTYVILFSCVALFLLLIACFNFMNLTTAQSVKRAKEIAIKKVAGANRKNIIVQFLGESILLTALALIIGIACVELILPAFNKVTNNDISLWSSFTSIRFWLFLSSMLIFTALAGSSYPAFYLSRLQPNEILRTSGNQAFVNGKLGLGKFFSKSLVILQFTISISIVAATFIVMLQLNHLRNHDMGFKKNDVMILRYPAGDTMLYNHSELIRNELKNIPGVIDIATGDHVPGEKTGRILFTHSNNGKERTQAINFSRADYNYPKLLGLSMVNGRWFSSNFADNFEGPIVINQACAKFLNLENPIGHTLKNGLSEGKIIGVIQDYNYASLKESIEPMVFMLASLPSGDVFGRTILIKSDPTNSSIAAEGVTETWKKLFPNHPLKYTYLSDSINSLYEKEDIMMKILGYFALLTILISCLGLFALSSYSTEKRTKEIGIRKVLGASNGQIIKLLLMEFIILVIIANLIATPITWYLMNKWLFEFAYRINIPFLVFIVTACVSIFIAALTVSIKARSAAQSNPVNSLRYE
jgi:putative ABC transport system permease protein